MRICTLHWVMCRQAVVDAGLDSLITKNDEAMMADVIADIQGLPDINHERFDPLMSMNWHFHGQALKAGGFAVMGEGPESNGGHYCPICELATHYPDQFDPQKEINSVASQMQTWARNEGLVPKPA